MGKFTDRTGEKHLTQEGYQIEIIEYFGVFNCTVIFEDGLILKNLRYASIKIGKVLNPYHPTVYGVGYKGIGKHKSSSNRKATKLYNTWKGIVERSYDKNWHINQPTYIKCSVAEDWKCFQKFGDWFEKNYKPYMEGWHLDKDILIKGNKIYSPETCCFVPQEINSLFVKCDKSRGDLPIGVVKVGKRFRANIHKNRDPKYIGTFDTPQEAFEAYKIIKEDYIKELASKWKPYITKPCYQALINYKVEITD